MKKLILRWNVCLAVVINLGLTAGTFARAAEPDARATLPLDEYLELRRKTEVPSLTSIEEISVSGKFQQKLTLKVAGASAGLPVTMNFLERNPQFTLHQCSGDAVLHLKDGQYAILPTSRRFTLNCSLMPKNWGELQFAFSNALAVDVKVEGMEAIVLSDSSDGQRVVLNPVQRGTRSSQVAQVSAIGRFHLSVLPEETRFVYDFQLNNPNPSKQYWELSLRSGEILQKVVFGGPYEELPSGGLRFTLNPGESHVALRGTIKGAKFQAPESGQQYVLLENHPMLQLKPKSGARRISPKDTGIASTYPGARGYFLVNGEEIEWEAQKLEVFSALGYSVSRAHYLVYVSERGRPVVETTMTVDNQGSPEIPIRIPGQATYLAINGQPQVLSKDADGNLLLQLNSGANHVSLQYQPEGAAGGTLAWVSQSLARPQAVLSNVNVQLALPAKWEVVVARGLNEVRSDLDPQGAAILIVIVLAGAFLIAVNVLGWTPARSGALLVPLTLALVLKPGFSALILSGAILAVLYRYRALILERFRRMPIRAALVASVAGLVVLVAGARMLKQATHTVGNLSSKMVINSYNSADEREMMRSAQVPKMADTAELGKVLPEGAGGAGGGYQGLPAKLTIPSDVRYVTFYQGMLDDGAAVRCFAILLSRSLIAWLAVLSFAGFSYAVYRSRRRLSAWLNQ